MKDEEKSKLKEATLSHLRSVMLKLKPGETFNKNRLVSESLMFLKTKIPFWMNANAKDVEDIVNYCIKELDLKVRLLG